MAVTHVVVFTWTEDTDPDTVSAIQASLQDLVDRGEGLDGLVSWRAGRDLGLVEGNADWAVVATFTDVAAYERYRDHPEHRRIVTESIRPHLAQRAGLQFEHE